MSEAIIPTKLLVFGHQARDGNEARSDLSRTADKLQERRLRKFSAGLIGPLAIRDVM